MTTMNISLPDSLKAFVDAEVDRRGFGTSSEYIRSLIRLEQDRAALRQLLLDGAAAPVDGTFDAAYFDRLRAEIRDQQAS